MSDMNSVNIIGRVVRDAKLKHSGGGTAFATFSLAVNAIKKQGDKWVEDPAFFDVGLMGKTAENLSAYLLKGSRVGVSGSLAQSKDGKVIVKAYSIELLGGGKPKGKKEEDLEEEEDQDLIPF